MVKALEITDKNKWESFVLELPEANFLQSWNWGEFHKNLGHQIIRTGFFDGDQLIGVMLSIVEKAKRGTYLTIPGGPLIDWQNKEITIEFKNSILEISKRFKCVFARVRPQVLETSENSRLFSDLGFISAPMHLHAELTHQLDLTKDEALLLAEMRKTTRYEIKQAQKLEIRIETSEDIEDFYKMQMDTARRQRFIPFSRDFLQKQFEIFVQENNVIIYTAWFGKIKLAQAFVIYYGQEADYHYGVSSEDGRKYPGAYLIQWEAIKEAKKRGMKRYNFWGVAPEGEKSHRFYGVSVFKRGFGGEDVAYLHARDLVVNWPKYVVNYVVEALRKWIRKV
jgi:lipid II:glycine glycyltransferase (peptidoglycan interpeptide bridge formation enzyme)